MRAASRVAAAASVIAGAIGIGLFSAHADPVADGRPTHLSLGTVSAAAGETRLPRDKVKVAWRAHVATTLRDEALVRAGEPTVVADPRAGVFTLLGPGGEVQHTVAVSSQGFAGKPLRLADGTVVAVTTTGDVVGYRREQLRFRVPVGAGAGAGHVTPALLALDDGGFVLGLDSELLAFDGHGALRARTGLSDRITGTLAAFGSPVAAIAAMTSSGMVVTWSPGGEVRAAGELGDARPSIVGGERTMTAIVDAQRIVDLDVVTHELRTREEARGAALFLDGPLALRSPARSFAVLELDGTHLSVLVYPRTPPSPGGFAPEPRRTRLATLPGLASADAGAAPAAAGTAAGRSGAPGSSRSAAIPATGAAPLLVPAAELVADASGAFAFALAGGGVPPGGVIGIADPATGTVTTLDRTLCLPDAGAAAPTGGQPARPGESPRTDIAGLAIGIDELVVTCGDGDVVALVPLSSPALAPSTGR